MAFDPIGWFNRIPNALKLAIGAVLCLSLVGAAGFWYGRHSAPEKIVTKTETVIQEKIVTQVQVQEKVVYKDRVVTKTQYVHDAVVSVDDDTKCDEKYDNTTGHLVERVCEKSHHTVDVEHDERYTSVVRERDELQTKVTNLTQQVDKLTHSTTTTTVTNSTKDRWMVGLGGGLTLNSSALTWSAQGAFRLVGPFWIGGEIDTNKSIRANLLLSLP